MADTNSLGFLTAYDSQNQIRNEISSVAVNWFINRTPLITRLARVPVGSVAYSIVTRKFRPRVTTLGAAIASTSATTITLSDASPFMNGDVLQIGTEQVEITSDPIGGTTNTATVRRGVAGTTAATATNGAGVLLIGNSRTGSEVNQNGTNYVPISTLQYNQTFQHPVQVGGSLQSSSAFVPAADATTPLDGAKMLALQNLMDDMEVSSYYGLPESPTSGNSRPKQAGLINQFVTNNTQSPTGAGAYTPTNLIRDTVEKCRSNGGNPDVLVVSSDFQTGFAVWQMPIYRIMAGNTIFGTAIDTFQAPLAGAMTIVYAPLLAKGTAICLSTQEVRMRMKRNEFWNPRGNRGDAIEGDFIAEGSVEADNEYHHAWVSGITGFSAT